MARILVTAMVCLVCMPACEQPEPVKPVEVYRAFHEAVSIRQWDRAVSFLCARDRELFRSIGARLGTLVEWERDPMDLFLSSIRAEWASPLSKLELVRSEGDLSVVRVSAGDCASEDGKCSKTEARLIFEAGHWRIKARLPELLKKTPETPVEG